MWTTAGLAASLVVALTATFFRGRAAANYYEREVYHMDCAAHGRYALAFWAFAALFAAAAIWPALPTTPLLAVFALIAILYGATFLRGATGEEE